MKGGEWLWLKKVKSSIVFLLALVLMLAACSNKEMPEGNENDVDILGEDDIGGEKIMKYILMQI